MNIKVRFYTKSGNTEKLAKEIGKALGVMIHDVSVPLEEKADILFLGCSYYGFDVDPAVKQFVQENREKIGKIVCFGTSAMMKSVYKPMKKIADEAGIELAEEDFHCRGEFGPFHKGRPDAEDCRKAAEFAKKAAGM